MKPPFQPSYLICLFLVSCNGQRTVVEEEVPPIESSPSTVGGEVVPKPPEADQEHMEPDQGPSDPDFSTLCPDGFMDTPTISGMPNQHSIGPRTSIYVPPHSTQVFCATVDEPIIPAHLKLKHIKLTFGPESDMSQCPRFEVSIEQTFPPYLSRTSPGGNGSLNFNWKKRGNYGEPFTYCDDCPKRGIYRITLKGREKIEGDECDNMKLAWTWLCDEDTQDCYDYYYNR